MERLRVMVVFGGRSREHEVSLASAKAVMETLKASGRHEVIPAGITPAGGWILEGDPIEQLENGQGGGDELPPGDLGGADVVFPVLHGPYGEDGAVQGMLEMAGVPYVGSGVLASAVGMDKISMKKIFAYHGLPQTEWMGITTTEWRETPKGLIGEIESRLGYPCFVKPSNLGSSVGISRADGAEDLAPSIEAALSFDRRAIAEREVSSREIEVSVLGNEEPEVSVPGEIVVNSAGFYDYEAKYAEGGMELVAPAEIPPQTTKDLQNTARTAYAAVDASGMARMDFFLENGSGRLLINEINTIPGFTATSVYAKLWQASGLSYSPLLDRLIDLALDRRS